MDKLSNIGLKCNVLILFLLCRRSLNNEIQQLEQHLQSSILDDERRNSHFSACVSPFNGVTESRGVDNPIVTPIRPCMSENVYPQSFVRPIESTPFGPQNEIGFKSVGPCNLPPLSFGNPPIRVETENVNYTEGCEDKRWSRRDFPWTKELEVCFTFIIRS